MNCGDGLSACTNLRRKVWFWFRLLINVTAVSFLFGKCTCDLNSRDDLIADDLLLTCFMLTLNIRILKLKIMRTLDFILFVFFGQKGLSRRFLFKFGLLHFLLKFGLFDFLLNFGLFYFLLKFSLFYFLLKFSLLLLFFKFSLLLLFLKFSFFNTIFIFLLL